MSQATTIEASEHPAIRCLFELRYDGTVLVLAKQGCTSEEIRELLGQLAGGTWVSEPANGTTAQSELLEG